MEITEQNKKIDFENVSTDILIKMVRESLTLLYSKEKELFVNDASERDLVFHFARYFIKILEKYNYDLEKYSIDFEYNRNRFNEKKYKDIIFQNKKYRIIPDLLLHVRGSNDNNIIAFEFKKKYKKSNYTKRNKPDDIIKLKALTKQDYIYRYKLGLLICFEDGNNYIIKKFINNDEKL